MAIFLLAVFAILENVLATAVPPPSVTTSCGVMVGSWQPGAGELLLRRLCAVVLDVG
jgi:hypothetical protein